MCQALSCPEDSILSTFLLSLAVLPSPPPLPCISLSLGGSDVDILFIHGPSVVTCFLCFDELCVSTFSVVTAKRLRAALIDKHRHKYLGGGFRT